jgi:hypothetical protein
MDLPKLGMRKEKSPVTYRVNEAKTISRAIRLGVSAVKHCPYIDTE